MKNGKYSQRTKGKHRERTKGNQLNYIWIQQEKKMHKIFTY